MNLNDKHIKTGFETPKDYFESFDSRLFNRMDLNSVKENTGFKMPDGYLETFDDKLFNRLEEENKKTRTLKPYYYGIISTVAAVLVIAFLVFNVNTSDTISFETVNVSSIENYLDDNYLDLSDDDISDLFTNTSEFSFNLNIDDDLILDYLEDHNDNTSLLIE